MIKFRLNKYNLDQLINRIRSLNLKNAWNVSILPYSYNRSLEQNNMYWEMITQMADYFGNSKDQMHDLMRYKFLYAPKEIYNIDYFGKVKSKDYKQRDNRVIPIYELKSTSKLTVKEFGEYITSVMQFGEEYGFYFIEYFEEEFEEEPDET
jgi:hypothetical protein